MKSKNLLKLLGAIVLAAVIAMAFVPGCAKEAPAPTPAPEAEVIKWRLQTWVAAGEFNYETAVKWAERVTKMSEGRLVIEPFPAGAILPTGKEFEGLSKGTVEVANFPLEWAMGLRPALAAFSAMSGGPTAIQYHLWWQSGGGTELSERAIEGLEVVSIGALVLEPPEIWAHSTVPLNSMDDIKGLKIRLGSAPQREIFTKMGAAPLFMPGGECYEAASRGLIDAFEYTTPSVNWSLGFQEVADYLYLSPTRSPHGYHGIYVNKSAWEELTPSLKLIVQEATTGSALRAYAQSIVRDGEALQKFVDYGTKVKKLPVDIEDELKRAGAEYYDEQAAADPFFAEILESQRAFKRLCELQDIR